MKTDIDLAAFFVGVFNNNKGNKGCLEFLIESEVPKTVLIHTYNVFLKDEVLVPVELLTTEEKMKLVDKCRTTDLKFTNETLTDAARILYTINFINENT